MILICSSNHKVPVWGSSKLAGPFPNVVGPPFIEEGERGKSMGELSSGSLPFPLPLLSPPLSTLSHSPSLFLRLSLSLSLSPSLSVGMLIQTPHLPFSISVHILPASRDMAWPVSLAHSLHPGLYLTNKSSVLPQARVAALFYVQPNIYSCLLQSVSYITRAAHPRPFLAKL